MRFCKTFLSRIGQQILNILCPPLCPICQTEIDEAHGLCPKCYQKLRFITEPCCQICGRPFEYKGLGKPICAKCMKKKPSYDMARSVLEYDDFSKKLILLFKHADKTELTPLFTKFLKQVDSKLFKNTDMIIPVPLHWTRRVKRQYNQSALLAKSLGKELKIPFNPTILKRIRHTVSQGHLTHKQRQKNVHNAFQVKHSYLIKGKTILVIDDVMTTGSTLNECAKILKKSGVKSVKVLTMHRVLR